MVTPLPVLLDFTLPDPSSSETYYDYLQRALHELDALGCDLFRDGPLDQLFLRGELVVPGYYRKLPPPREFYKNFVLPLALTLKLRQTQVDLGFGPLVVVATYRPSSGAGKSRHKVNAAIDVKPPKLTRAACRALMRGAGWVYRHHAHLQVGVGSYGPHMDRTTLVHIDAGQRTRRTSWRHVAGVSVETAVPHAALLPWEVA